MPTKIKSKEKADISLAEQSTIEYPTEYKPLFIPTKLILHNRFNPRTEADITADEELRQSIGIRGVETPIHVRPIEEDEEGHIYEVYDGDRRLRAAIKTKLAKVPVIIKDRTDDQVIEFGMVSTIRRGLNDVEKGRALLALKERFPFKYRSQREMALSLGTSVATINRYIKAVTSLDPEVQGLIAPEDSRTRNTPEGSIDGRTAYEIGKIDDQERQRELAHIIIEKGFRGEKARQVITDARLDPEVSVESIVKRVQLQSGEAFIPTLVLTSDEYQLVKAGKKTTVIERSLRPGVKADARVEPLIKAEPLEVLDVFRRTLGRFTDDDAKREGLKTLEQLKSRWIGKHGSWNEEESVYVVQFKAKK